MRLILHAIAPAEPPAVAAPGLRGQSLVVVRQADVSAYATLLEAPADPFGRADLLDHHEIIVGLAEHVASILPARFPTWLANEEALRAELLRRQAEFLEALERVR